MLVGIGALFESIVMSKSTGKKELPMSSADQTRNKTWRLSPDLLGFVNLDGFFLTQTLLGKPCLVGVRKKFALKPLLISFILTISSVRSHYSKI
jgi:hypothetical protein